MCGGCADFGNSLHIDGFTKYMYFIYTRYTGSTAFKTKESFQIN